MNATTTDTITIPVEAFEHMFVIMGALSQMHLRLINLYEIESDLKKRHKATCTSANRQRKSARKTEKRYSL